jgi:hypothetical protein
MLIDVPNEYLHEFHETIVFTMTAVQDANKLLRGRPLVVRSEFLHARHPKFAKLALLLMEAKLEEFYLSARAAVVPAPTYFDPRSLSEFISRGQSVPTKEEILMNDSMPFKYREYNDMDTEVRKIVRFEIADDRKGVWMAYCHDEAHAHRIVIALNSAELLKSLLIELRDNDALFSVLSEELQNSVTLALSN